MPDQTDIALAEEATEAAPLRRVEVGATSGARDAFAAACPNCGAQFSGRYCSNCGERRVAGEDYSLGRFLHEAFNILTSVESNLFRSFAALLTRPGRLTAEYFRGRRKSYLKPLQLFVFCNVIFFFAHSYLGFNSLTTPLYVHLNMLPHSRLARHLVDSELRARNLTYEQYRPRFDAAIEGQAKTLVIVMVPLYALLLQAFYWRTRRYYVEHLVFSLHFFAFLLLLLAGLHALMFVGWRIRRVFGFDLSSLQNDDFATLLMLSLCGTYLFFALRRAYGQGRTRTALKCLALTLCIIAVIQLYRFILFFTTFYTI
ncbi:MAG TPA: DUF3667 domain-containing protein [Pyrinomonadaceae bacterium]|nr:DUF3667 domain-containing protein [Pyrinomonadaceae bacterium]